MRNKLDMKIKDRVISVHSPIKAGMEFDFADAIEEMIVKEPTKKILIDLTQAPFINSATLGILLNCHKELMRKDAALDLKIKRPSDISHLFEITKLTEAFDIEWVE